MPIIKFIKEKKEIEVAEGVNLRQAALQAGVNLYQGLNGFGADINKYVNCYGVCQATQGILGCGTCKVLIKKGMENTNPLSFSEKVKFNIPLPDPLPAFSYIGHEHEMRLACCTTVEGDIEVETGPEVNLFGDNFFS